MTCPCVRPGGLSDEGVRRFLAGPNAYPGLVTSFQGVDGIWHVTTWRRCGAMWHAPGLRCELRAGHEVSHMANGQPFVLGDRPAPEGEPTWAVPCWVTTAAEAETWRPEFRAVLTPSPALTRHLEEHPPMTMGEALGPLDLAARAGESRRRFRERYRDSREAYLASHPDLVEECIGPG